MFARLSRMRKAIAAAIVPLLGLPIGAWVSGETVFDAGTLAMSIASSIVAGVGVYYTPNKTV